MKATTTVQTKAAPSSQPNAGSKGAAATPPAYGIDFVDRQPAQSNRTGLPDGLKAGIEGLSGLSLDNVRVHYNSPKPAQLQALAYTQGTDIHIGPGQEHHLAHEAWHVVQQAQGRVRPTIQLKNGTAINDEQGLEAEADSMGAEALNTGSRFVISNDGMPTLALSHRGIVQRAVGFEFETGWLVREKGQPLKKKTKIGTQDYTGFKIEADEAADKQSEIEFIVHPPIPVTRGTRSQLDQTMDRITALGNDLLAARVINGWNSLDNVTGQTGDADFEFFGFDSNMSAGPQVTSGLSLEQIASIPHATRRTPLPEGSLQTLTEIQNVDLALEEKDLDQHTLPFRPMSQKLKGLLTVIVSHLNVGAQSGLEYPKQVADYFLLARTDFAKLFAMLPENEYEYYKNNAGHWINLILRIADMEGESKENVIKKGIRPTPMAPYTPVGPTREMWLIYMTKGADLLSGQLDDDFESMGELKDKTEEVGSGIHRTAGAIFEFRGFQRNKIPLSEWKPFALTFFDFLLNLQNPGELENQERANRSREKYYAKLGIF